MEAAQPVRPSAGRGGLILAAAGTAVLAVLVLVLFGLLLFYVPSAKKTFDQYGMALPWATLTAIRASNWVAEYWWCAAPFFAMAGAGNFALLYLLGRQGRVAPAILLAAEAIFFGALVALTVVSIELPMAKLQQGLAG
jgi:type II secretory pathway component PulF